MTNDRDPTTDLPPGRAASVANLLADIIMEDSHKERGLTRPGTPSMNQRDEP